MLIPNLVKGDWVQLEDILRLLASNVRLDYIGSPHFYNLFVDNNLTVAGAANIAGALSAASLDTSVIQNSGIISIKPSGDTSDYLQLQTSANVTIIRRISDDDLNGIIQFESDNSNWVSVRVYEAGSTYAAFAWDKQNNKGLIFSYTELNIQTNNSEGGTSDYIQFKTASNVPEITTVGGCNLKITASGGTINFDDENLSTTGTLAAGATTLSGNLILGANSITGTSVDISNAELQQLSKIGATTISEAQWGYLGACTAAGGALLDDADAAAQRTTLGLGTIATQAANNVDIDGGAIDGTTIGGTTQAAGTFTDLTATGTVQGEHLYSTDDALIDDQLQVSGRLGVMGAVSSNYAFNAVWSSDVATDFGSIQTFFTDTLTAIKGFDYGLNFVVRRKPPTGDNRVNLLVGINANIGVETDNDSSNSPSALNARSINSAISAVRGTGATGTPVITTGTHFYANNATVTNGSITTLYAFYDAGQTVGGTNWGFYGLSAQNLLSGNLRVGSTNPPTVALDVNGAAHIGDGTNELQVSPTGDVIFAGTAGLSFAGIYINDNDVAQTIGAGATYVKLTGTATNGESNNCTADGANTKITTTKAGIYKIST